MKLEPEHESMLAGRRGASVARAMRTLVAYGEAFGADRMVPIASAHLAGSLGIRAFQAYLDVLGEFTRDGVRVAVPTTVNPRPGFDLNLANRFVFAMQDKLERRL